MKIKTFTFEDNSILKYNKMFNRRDFEPSEYDFNIGEYYYFSHSYIIDDTINRFIEENNIEVIDIRINNIVRGNNPPTSILVYTIYYKEGE
jgi:hypothetical protein